MTCITDYISAYSVLLKVWENSIHSKGPQFSRQDEEMACQGSLFCIITFDIRDPATAESVFSKWVPIKEKLLPESFLFVIGSFSDQIANRLVDMKQMCKACALKEAIYLEVSNYEGNNIELLRELLADRISFLLKQRESLLRDDDDNDDGLEGDEFEDHLHPHSERNDRWDGVHEGKGSEEIEEDIARRSSPRSNRNVVCASVGSILSSCLDTSRWDGFDENTKELTTAGKRIMALLEDLEREEMDEYSVVGGSTTTHRRVFDSASGEEEEEEEEEDGCDPLAAAEYVDRDLDLSEMQAAFELMGLPFPEMPEDNSFVSAGLPVSSHSNQSSLPRHLQGRGGKTVRKKLSSYLRKLVVKLPDGSPSEMVLDLEANMDQQIELFLLSHSLSENDSIRRRLIDITSHILAEYHKQMQEKEREAKTNPLTGITVNLIDSILPEGGGTGN